MPPQRNSLPYWKRYYYDYIGEFVGFLVPADAGSSYFIATDKLGCAHDAGQFLRDAKSRIPVDGRIVITQYSALWEPVLRVASALGLRDGKTEQNWLSKQDVANLAYLNGLEIVKSGTKMLLPVYIPGLAELFNTFLANIWPFSHLGIFNYFVLRKIDRRAQTASVAIVVPARNEAGTIEKMARELPQLGFHTELIFIEGNSTDNTYAEIERVASEYGTKRTIKYAKQSGRGKGDAVRKGFDMAESDILMIYDADMTVPPEEIRGFYDAIVENKADFVNGSRLVYPLEQDSMRVLNFFGNKFFSAAFTWILGQPLKDTLCGTKVIWRSDYEKVKKGRVFFGDFDPFGDFDLLFGAAKLNLKIIDLPVHYKQRVYGTTNISRWKHGWLLLRMTAFAAGKFKFI